MNGFIRISRDDHIWRYQRAGSRAVWLEIRGQWMAAEAAWRRAANIAPRTDWKQFAWRRAEYCYRCYQEKVS